MLSMLDKISLCFSFRILIHIFIFHYIDSFCFRYRNVGTPFAKQGEYVVGSVILRFVNLLIVIKYDTLLGVLFFNLDTFCPFNELYRSKLFIQIKYLKLLLAIRPPIYLPILPMKQLTLNMLLTLHTLLYFIALVIFSLYM